MHNRTKPRQRSVADQDIHLFLQRISYHVRNLARKRGNSSPRDAAADASRVIDILSLEASFRRRAVEVLIPQRSGENVAFHFPFDMKS